MVTSQKTSLSSVLNAQLRRHSRTKNMYNNIKKTSCLVAVSVSDLLKFATMMGIGRVIHNTPQIAHSEATSFPAAVRGAISPYPIDVH